MNSQRTVFANGLRFSLFEEGEGPLVLLLHGFPDTAHTWDHVRPAVARAGFRAVAPFGRGYHPTAIPEDHAYDAETLGKDVLGLIEALGEEKTILVGHDWGAGAAFSAASLAPEKIRLLVTMGVPHPASVVLTPLFLYRVRHFFSLRTSGAARKIRDGDFQAIDSLMRRWSPEWDLSQGETDAVKAAFREPGCIEAALGYYRAFSPILPALLRRKIAVPAVAFAGDRDIVSPKAFERARSRYAGPYEVVRMPGGHFMHREHPEHFMKELMRVLEPYRRAYD
jgi:pimeloyl-ACP methyl ester carboxylesterase